MEIVLSYSSCYFCKWVKGGVGFGCNISWASASYVCVFVSVEDICAMMGGFRRNSTVLLILYEIFCGEYLFTGVIFHHWSNVPSCFPVWLP